MRRNSPNLESGDHDAIIRLEKSLHAHGLGSRTYIVTTKIPSCSAAGRLRMAFCSRRFSRSLVVASSPESVVWTQRLAVRVTWLLCDCVGKAALKCVDNAIRNTMLKPAEHVGNVEETKRYKILAPVYDLWRNPHGVRGLVPWAAAHPLGTAARPRSRPSSDTFPLPLPYVFMVSVGRSPRSRCLQGLV